MVIRNIARHLPPGIKSFAKARYHRGRHPAHAALKKVGTVQDLYYWVSDGNLDTLLVLQNYFSALYPGLDTNTEGTVSLYAKNGDVLGTRSFELVQYGAAKFRVSSLLQDLQIAPDSEYGTLQVNIDIPNEVLLEVRDRQPFYFWDRFYIGYVNRLGQICFTHGVDKTHIYRNGISESLDWYESPGGLQWAPEIPIDIADYRRFNVILINRTSRGTNMTLTLLDTEDSSQSWEAQVPPKGVHRFEFNRESTKNLNPKELRMRITGMATQFGRPIVFKEFSNGAISAMHC